MAASTTGLALGHRSCGGRTGGCQFLATSTCWAKIPSASQAGCAITPTTVSRSSTIKILQGFSTRPRSRSLATWDASCLLYTSDAADEEDSVDLGGRRIL